MFDGAYFDREIAGLEAQLAEAIVLIHRLEGALQVLQQMRAQVGAGDNAAPTNTDTAGALALEDLNAMLPDGYTVDTERGIQPHEN